MSEHRPWDVEAAITADSALTGRQKATLIDIYRSFAGEPTHAMQRLAEEPAPSDDAAPVKAARQTRTRARATKKVAVKQAPAKKAPGKQAGAATPKKTTKKSQSKTQKKTQSTSANRTTTKSAKP